MSKSIPAPAVIATLLVAFVASQASHAAPDGCLTAPNSAAPKGQHWYYHLDRANNRKCWYLHDLVATVARPAVAPARQADKPAPPVQPDQAAATTTMDSPAAAQPAQPATPPQPAEASPSPPRPDAASTQDVFSSAPPIAPPADAATVAPSQSAAAPATPTASTDPSPSTPAPADHAAAAPPPATPAIADAPAPRAGTKTQAAAAEAQVSNASVAQTASKTSVGQNVLVILLAALLAGAVFAVYAVLRRRRPTGIRGARNGPRFGSRPEHDDGLWLKWPRRARDNEAEPDAPIQSSLIPRQAGMARHSAPRGSAHV